MERNDGSTLFRNDASFFRRAGLADARRGLVRVAATSPAATSGTSTTCSYNQPVSTAADRADATFHLE